MSSTTEILDRLYAAFVGEGSPDRQLLADAHSMIYTLMREGELLRRDVAGHTERLAALQWLRDLDREQRRQQNVETARLRTELGLLRTAGDAELAAMWPEGVPA